MAFIVWNPHTNVSVENLGESYPVFSVSLVISLEPVGETGKFFFLK